LSVSIVASREVGLDHTQVHGVVGVAAVSGRDGQERLRAVPELVTHHCFKDIFTNFQIDLIGLGLSWILEGWR